MGRGWRLGILDDLLKGRAAADSTTQRETVWNWYTSDFLSRAQGSAPAIVFITARWHTDDPAARIRRLHEDGVEAWRILSYAALDDDDNALAEDLRPASELIHTRKVLTGSGDTRSWHALYQSKPIADDGEFFKSEWFKRSVVKWMPDHGREGWIRIYGATDYAASEGTGDWTTHLIFGIDPEDDMHILDLWRGRTTADVWVDRLLDLVDKWAPLGVAEEKGGLASMVRPFLIKRANERRVNLRLSPLPSTSGQGVAGAGHPGPHGDGQGLLAARERRTGTRLRKGSAWHSPPASTTT